MDQDIPNWLRNVVTQCRRLLEDECRQALAGKQKVTLYVSLCQMITYGENCTMKRYAIVIEKAESNYAAYVPDLPGCIATGVTVEETERLLREAIELHVEGMREYGLPVPEPSSHVEYLDVNAW